MKFQPGQSGNPAGRPVGSRNRRTIAAERLFDEAGDQLTKILIDLARKGHPAALRLSRDDKTGPGRRRSTRGTVWLQTSA